MTRLALLLACLAIAAQGAEPPPLLQLKQLAESGNPQAEFEYGTRISYMNSLESFTNILRSAESGYGPAENWVGGYFSTRLASNKTELKRYRRKAVLFTARAAYKNIPQAQGRLAEFYSTGDVLPKGLALAYGWAAIALRVSSETESPIITTQYRVQLNRLIAVTPTQEIEAGQRFADSYRAQPSGMTRVEADLIASGLRLTGVIAGNPILNDMAIKPGVVRKVLVEGEPVEIMCLGVKADSAQFQFVGTNFYVLLPLGRSQGNMPVVKSW